MVGQQVVPGLCVADRDKIFSDDDRRSPPAKWPDETACGKFEVTGDRSRQCPLSRKDAIEMLNQPQMDTVCKPDSDANKIV